MERITPGPFSTRPAQLHSTPAPDTSALDSFEATWLTTVARLSDSLWWITDQTGLIAGYHLLSAYTGLPETHLLGAGWLDAIAAVDRPAARQRWRTFVPDEAPFETPWRFVRPDGQSAWLGVRRQPLPATPDTAPRWLWVAHPTPRQRAAGEIGEYRTLFEQTAQGILMLDAQGAALRANEAALSMLGLSFNQARGTAALPAGWRCEQEDGRRLKEPFHTLAEVSASAAVAAGHAPERLYWQIFTEPGAAGRWLSFTCSPMPDSQRHPRRLLVFVQDVTERMRNLLASQSLAAASTGDLSALRAALDRITDALVVLDYSGRFTYVNARAHAQFASDDESLLGRPFWEAFPALTGTEMEVEYHRILRDPTPSVFETHLEDTWYEVRSYPGPDGISAYIRDVTSEHRARADLDAALTRERETRAEAETRAQQLDAIFEAVGDGMLVFGADGAALGANQTMRTLVSMLGGELALPMPVAQLDEALRAHAPAPDERGAALAQALQRILAGDTLAGAHTIDLALRTADGRDLYLNVGGAPIRGAAGQIEGAVTNLRDVTAKREAERERDRTLSFVSHELRTPLTAIKLSLDLTMRRANQELGPDATTVGVAISSCLQLERMVNDLVDMSRAEREQMALSFARHDAAALATQAVAEQQATTAKAISFAAPLEPLAIIADAARIRQVLSNLLSNAVKYSPPESGVALLIERRGADVWFGVSDGGPGVPAEAAPHLFEAFYRAPGVVSQTGPHIGLGLGLFLCKRIVDLHGGQIDQRNRPEGGSLFWFTLPVAPAEDEAGGAPNGERGASD